MVASKGEGGSKRNDHDDKDNFAVVMAPPAKRAKTAHCVVPWKECQVVKSDNVFDAFLIKPARLLDDHDKDTLAITTDSQSIH